MSASSSTRTPHPYGRINRMIDWLNFELFVWHSHSTSRALLTPIGEGEYLKRALIEGDLDGRYLNNVFEKVQMAQ